MDFIYFINTKAFRVFLTAVLSLVFLIPAAPAQLLNEGLWKGGWDNRYFTYNGQFPYYVGVDLQQLVSDVSLDAPGVPGSGYRTRLDLMADYDINKVRIWLNTAWFGLIEHPYIIYPWKVVGGKFDLNQWNDAYWTRLVDAIDYAATKNIIVEVSIFSVQGPKDYFKNTQKRQAYIRGYAFRNDNNIQGFGTPNSSQHFLPEFFNLNYKEGSQSLEVYQKDYVDKIFLELGGKNNVYFELMNEAPALVEFSNGVCAGLKWEAEYAAWANAMVSYMKATHATSQLINAHTNGYMSVNANKNCSFSVFDQASAYFWNEPDLDGMNFHFYTGDPNIVSDYLNSHQRKGKMLLNNEGGEYYDLNRKPGYPDFIITQDSAKLKKEIRHAWGHAVSGSYYTIYHGPVPQFTNSDVVVEALEFAQAMRHIVEKVPFQTMRPVRASDGSEYDDLVSQGPSSDWQVLASEGEAYLVYFWNNQSTTSVEIVLPAGDYDYEWYDVRRYDKNSSGPPLLSGYVTANIKGVSSVPAPATSAWDQDSGLALVMRRVNGRALAF